MRRGLLRSMGNGFEPEYQAVLNYATTQGYTKPSPSQQVKQNQLVVDLVNFGIWDKLDVFRLFITDSSLEFARINWINPFSNYMTFLEIGDITLVPNSHIERNSGNISYANNYIPNIHASKYLLNDASVGYFNKGFTNNLATDEGVFFAANNGLTQLNFSTWLYDSNFSCRIWINKDGAASQFGSANRFITSAANTHINTGLLNNTAVLFKNETQMASVSLIPNGLTSQDIVFNKGVDFDREYECWYIGAYLTLSDQSNLKTALTNYKNSL